MKNFIIKNKKSVIISLILFFIIQIISLIPVIYVGIKNNLWDLLSYIDFLTIFTIILLCIMLIYREWKINRIRRKTKNWVDPLKEEDKAKYKTFVNSVLYETLLNIIVLFITFTIYYSI